MLPRTRLSHTSQSHVIDSNAWIEDFIASRKGEKAKKFVEAEAVQSIGASSQILDLTSETAIIAGDRILPEK